MTIQENDFMLPSEGQTLNAFVARPADDQPHAAVVVIHEVFGLDATTRGVCRRFAKEGYVALAIDLFSGGFKPFCIARTMTAVFGNDTDNYGTRHIRNALTYLTMQPYADANRLGAIGFCLGGNFALATAKEDKRVKTIAPFYGKTPLLVLKNPSGLCPVVGSYPEKDFTAKEGRQLDAALTEANIPHDIKVYPGARHSFMNGRTPMYNPEASADAWQRTFTFFGNHL